MTYSIALINLFVHDMARSRHFYCEVLGIPPAEPDGPKIDKFLRLDMEGPPFYLHWTPPDYEDYERELDYSSRNVEFYLKVDDIDEVAHRVQSQGAKIRKLPYNMDWAPWRCLEVEDPDGYLLFLVSDKKNV